MLDDFNKVFAKYRRVLLNSFWFLPAVVSVLGPVLAFLFLVFDHILPPNQEQFVFHGGTAEATVILSTIAGSLITVAGLAFSITIVVLQLVSSQYTPRALRGFLQDRVTQVVAGGFFAIFAYSMIVLASITEPSATEPGFLPAISITGAIGLGFLGLALLLIFVHHIGRVIQVSDIAARLATQTLQTLENPYPTWENDEPKEEATTLMIQTWLTSDEPARIRAMRPGYVQRVEFANLMKYLRCPGFHLHLLVCPGDFVTEETVIAEVRPMGMADSGCIKAVHDHVIIERERDIEQDARFGVRQLADIALRALSPAINDPTTGVLCIKYLQAVFEQLIHRLPISSTYRFAGGASSLEIRQPALEEYLEVLLEIGHYTGGNVRVLNTLLSTLERVTEIAAQLNIEEHQALLAAMTASLSSQLPLRDSIEEGSSGSVTWGNWL